MKETRKNKARRPHVFIKSEYISQNIFQNSELHKSQESTWYHPLFSIFLVQFSAAFFFNLCHLKQLISFHWNSSPFIFLCLRVTVFYWGWHHCRMTHFQVLSCFAPLGWPVPVSPLCFFSSLTALELHCLLLFEVCGFRHKWMASRPLL